MFFIILFPLAIEKRMNEYGEYDDEVGRVE